MLHGAIFYIPVPGKNMIVQLIMSDEEVQSVKFVLDELCAEFTSPEDPDFLSEATVIAHELPLRIRRFINNFRLTEPEDNPVCLISGYPVDNEGIGKTPSDRGAKDDISRTLNEQLFLVLLGSLLGETVGWSTQQAGHIVHDIAPVAGQETEQTGSSSKAELLFHTEDAFHPYRGDYLGMMCLRNHTHVPTSLVTSRAVSLLTEQQQKKLFEPCVFIRPDASQYEKHTLPKSSGLTDEEFDEFIQYSENKIKQMDESPEPIPILFGSPSMPYMRVDCPVYMEALDEEATEAVQALSDAFERCQSKIVMQPGDICFIDNFRAVHGRKPFKARYDGTDRWLKRVNITRDLRKSRDMRMNSSSRIIF